MMPKNYLRIIHLAIPIILANASVPLLGLADTAAIGQTGAAADLGAIALASLIFSFVFWGFGFLRMGTTGFMAQAAGANNEEEMHALIFRSLLLAILIGFVLIVFQKLIGQGAISLLNASTEVKLLVEDYFYIRIWGAPATLLTFAILGAFIGRGWTRLLLYVQLLLNGTNILLNVTFIVLFGMGVKGIALGTIIAEYLTLITALYLLFKKMEIKKPMLRIRQLIQQIIQKEKLVALFRVNADIMIRTLALITGFAYFTNQAAKFGDETLAANHILLQFITFSAFILDGFAHVAELLSGQAFGARNRVAFIKQVKDSSVLAGGAAVLLALLIFLLSSKVIPLFSKEVSVQLIATKNSIFAALYVLISFVAFQLDGVFIGVTKSKEMRNATLITLFLFIASSMLLIPTYGNTGLWIAFILYVFFRGLTLSAYFPKLIKSITA